MKLSGLMFFAYCVVLVSTTTVEDVKRLLARADPQNYDKRIRPLKNQTNAIEVKLGLILYSK
ncbi:hypothetical protein DPMN_137068 [Dreissena polymorpha]|uniref:Uncharacterized protein n=1 Tax=Dreissena polymorpha TaxID=45954 RepID=A0A9D4G1Z2_DREPO|nr:hypothetical protein DPMN_137068 [Dreissena polymorpha]